MEQDSYTIVSRIVLSDETGRGAESAEARLDQVERHGMDISQRLSRAFAAIGGLYMLKRAFSAITELNDSIDVATIGIASMFKANTGIEFAAGMRVARTEIQALQQDAANGVGELSDYMASYRAVLPQVLRAGGGTGVARELVRNSIAYGAGSGRDLQTVAFDLQQALTQGVGDRTTPVVAQALSEIRVSLAEFNAMGIEGRVETLQRAFASSAEAADAFGGTWGANLSTLTDGLKSIIKDVSRPLHDRWTGQLVKINQWIEAHKEALTQFAAGLGKAFLGLYDRAATLAPLLAGAGVGLLAARGVGGAVEMVQGGQGVLGGAGQLLGLGARMGPQGLGVTAGVGLAAGAASAALLASWRKWPQVLEAVTEETAGFMEAFGRLSTVLVSLENEFGVLAWTGKQLSGALIGLAWVGRQASIGFGVLAASVAKVVALALEGFGALFRVLRGEDFNTVALDVYRGRQAIDARFERRLAELFPTAAVGEEGGLPAGRPGDVRIGTVNVTVDTEVNADPTRVGIAWEEALSKAVRNAGTPRRLTRPLAAL